MACLRHAAVYGSDRLKVGGAISFARQTRPIDGGCQSLKDLNVIVEMRKAASWARDFYDGYHYRDPRCFGYEMRVRVLGRPDSHFWIWRGISGVKSGNRRHLAPGNK
jgi:hypothetical protein